MSKRPRAGAASLLPVRAPLAARKEFYSLLSHVHRTPLVGACGYIDFVLNEYAGKVQKKQRESLGQAREAILQLQRVIDAFMDLIAFELDLVPAASAAIDLAAFLRGLREELSSWARAERRSLRLSVPDSPVFVRADPEWLRVLVRELFSNAVRASPSRSAIEIELRKAYNSAVFTVGDQGPGVSTARLGRLFQPMSQPRRERSDVRGERGGMGLALAARIARLYSGRIRARRRPAGGLAVIVEFPSSSQAPHRNPQPRRLASR